MQVSDGRPAYIVVNADESEPGTCKVVAVARSTVMISLGDFVFFAAELVTDR